MRVAAMPRRGSEGGGMIPDVLIDQAVFRYCSSASSLACEGCGEASRPLPARVFSWALSTASKNTTHTQTTKVTKAGSATIQNIKFNKIPNSISFIWKLSPPSLATVRLSLHLGEYCVAFDARFSKNGGYEVRPPKLFDGRAGGRHYACRGNRADKVSF